MKYQVRKLLRRRDTPVINMAPLIDMVFLLLIFFMVTTNLAQQTGIEVRKPKAISSQLLPRKNTIITISPTSELFFEGIKVDLPELKLRLKARLASSPDSTVIINTDLDTRMGIVVDVMDECKLLSAHRLSIATSYEKWD